MGKKRLKAVRKTLGLMETTLRHPSLNTHKYQSLEGPNGQEVFDNASPVTLEEGTAMNEPKPDIVMHRLDRLKRVGSVLLVGLAAVGLMGQAKSKTATGAGLVVVPDARGKVHFGLAVGPDDSPRLFLSDFQTGKPRSGLVVPSPVQQGREPLRRAEPESGELADPETE